MITREIPNCSPESVLNIQGFKRNFKCYSKILYEVLMRARHIAQQYEKNQYVLFDLTLPDAFRSKNGEICIRTAEMTMFFDQLSDFISLRYGSQIQYVWTHHQEGIYRCLLFLREEYSGYPISLTVPILWSTITGCPIRSVKLDRIIEIGTILKPYDLTNGKEFDDQFRHCLTWASYLSQLDVVEGQELHEMRTYGMSSILDKPDRVPLNKGT